MDDKTRELVSATIGLMYSLACASDKDTSDFYDVKRATAAIEAITGLPINEVAWEPPSHAVMDVTSYTSQGHDADEMPF